MTPSIYDETLTGKRKYCHMASTTPVPTEVLGLVEKFSPEELAKSCENGPAAVIHTDQQSADATAAAIYQTYVLQRGSLEDADAGSQGPARNL